MTGEADMIQGLHLLFLCIVILVAWVHTLDKRRGFGASHLKEHPTLVLRYQKAIEIQVANTLRAFTNPCCGSLQLCGEVALRPVPEPNVEYLTLILVLFFHHAHRFLAVRGELFVNVNSFLQISMRRSVEGAVSCKLRKKGHPRLGQRHIIQLPNRHRRPSYDIRCGFHVGRGLLQCLMQDLGEDRCERLKRRFEHPHRVGKIYLPTAIFSWENSGDKFW